MGGLEEYWSSLLALWRARDFHLNWLSEKKENEVWVENRGTLKLAVAKYIHLCISSQCCQSHLQSISAHLLELMVACQGGGFGEEGTAPT